MGFLFTWIDVALIVLVWLAYRRGVAVGVKKGEKKAEVQSYRDRLVAVERQVNSGL